MQAINPFARMVIFINSAPTFAGSWGKNIMKNKHRREYWPIIFTTAFLFGGWQLLSVIINTPAFPGPISALIKFYQASFDNLWPNFLKSSIRVVISILLALFTAAPLGILLGREKVLDKLFTHIIYILYPIPKIVFLPLVMILMGLGDQAKIFIIFLIIFFQILVTTRDTARGLPQQYVYSILSLGAGRPAVYRHVVLPYCLPKILTAARVSLGTAISVLFFAETIAGTTGLGYFILDSWHRAEYGEMFAGILAMGLMGLLFYLILDYLEKIFCSWQYL